MDIIIMMSFKFASLQGMFRPLIALTLALQVGLANADPLTSALSAKKPVVNHGSKPSVLKPPALKTPVSKPPIPEPPALKPLAPEPPVLKTPVPEPLITQPQAQSLLKLIGIHTPQGMRVWAVKADTGEPLAGVKLLSTSQKKNAVGKVLNELKSSAVTTNAQGLAFIHQRDGDDLSIQGKTVIAGKTYTAQLVSKSTGLQGIERSRALIQTDKPVYRAGERLRGFAIIRKLQVGKRMPQVGKSKVKLVSPTLGLTLAQTELMTDAFGVLRFDLPLPSNLQQGQYELVVETPSKPTQFNPYPIADRSRIPVLVKATASSATLSLKAPTEVITGTSWPLTVTKQMTSAAVFSDKKVSRAKVFLIPKNPSATSHQSAQWFQSVQDRPKLPLPDWKNAPQALALLPFKSEQNQTQSLAESSFKVNAQPHQPRTFTLTVLTTDSLGEEIYAQQQITAYPSALKLQVNQAPTWGKDGINLGASLQFVGKDIPAANVEVVAELLRVTGAASRSTKSASKQVASHQEKLVEQKQKSDAQGVVHLTLRTKDLNLLASHSGNYVVRLRVKDAAGRELHHQIAVKDPPAKNQMLWVGLDKVQYKAGEVAKVNIQTKLPKGKSLLVSAYAEARTISKVIKVTGSNMTIDWPVSLEMTPAFEIQAVATQKGQVVHSQPAFALAPQLDQRVQLELKAGPEVRPGQSVNVQVKATQNGKPVAATVLLVGTNEKLYGVQEDLSPDPWRFFWGATQPQAKLIGQKVAIKPPINRVKQAPTFFPDQSSTLSFLQTVNTNVAGKATVKLKMPFASGQYRMHARAFTSHGAIGKASTVQKVGRPFVMKLGFPRVLSLGDTSQLQMKVSDRDQKTGQVKLSLDVQGQTQTEQVALKQGLAQKSFNLKVPTEGERLFFEAQAMNGKVQEKQRYAIPLRLAGHERRMVSRGRVTAGVPYNDLLTIPKDSKVKSLTFDMALTPLQLALTHLNVTIPKPHELWQTTDVLAANVRSYMHLNALAQKYNWQEVQQHSLNKAQSTLVDLMAFGQKDGWGWTRTRAVNAEMTGVVLITLLQAAELNLVDQVTVNKVYQQALKLAQNTNKVDPTLAAALAHGGNPKYAAALAANPITLQPIQAAKVAISLAKSDEALAKKAYAVARKAAKETKEGALLLGDPAAYQGQDEATAVLLQAATVLQESSDIAALTAALLDLRKGGGWEGPLATAEALKAFRPQAIRAGRDQPGKVVIQFVDWKKTFDLSAPVRFSVPIDKVKPGPFLIESTGAVAFSRVLSVQTPTEEEPPRDTIIERKYDRIKTEKGDVVQVTLTVSTNNPKAHLRVVDPIPGGMEIVSDQIKANSAQVKWSGRSFFDDRAIFYIEKLDKGSMVLQYKLRARAAGQYTAPGAYIEFVGSPIQIKGRAQKLEVK